MQLKTINSFKRCIQLYDVAITRQKKVIEDVRKGRMKYSEVSDKVLLALTLWELETLTKNQEDLTQELKKLEIRQAQVASEPRAVNTDHINSQSSDTQVEQVPDPVLSSAAIDTSENTENSEVVRTEPESTSKSSDQSGDKLESESRENTTAEVSLPLPEYDISQNNEPLELDYWS